MVINKKENNQLWWKYAQDIEIMKEYPHITACLIEVSLGYFSPKMATKALRKYKLNEPMFCEWYYDAAIKHGLKSREEIDKFLPAHNKNIISKAVKIYKRAHKNGKNIVEHVIKNNSDKGFEIASWF